jgi:hypothetical protein
MPVPAPSGSVSSPVSAAATSCPESRTYICVVSGFAVNELLDGKIVGTATWDYTQQLTLSATSLTWTEDDTATLRSVFGVSVDNSLGWITNCSGGCSPASRVLWPVTPMVTGDTLSGTVTFSAAPASGAVDQLTATPLVTVVDPVGNPASISFDLGGVGGIGAAVPPVRCDNGVAVSNSAGCTAPDYTPTLTIPTATYGAAAAMIQYAQSLSAIGTTLHRLASSSLTNTNRSIICNSTFVSGSTGVTNDSCDEYAFAASYESGALHGVTSGAQCAQVTAVRTATSGTTAQQWAAIRIISTGNGLCVRGHIPASLNSNVGSALGVFTKANRLIDKDPYMVTVS